LLDILLKSFSNPDEVREFEKGKFEILRVGGLTLGRATYQPGWKWSDHVGSLTGQAFCEVEHVGMVLQGTATAAFADHEVVELTPGSVFHIGARPHDSWVVGDTPYVSLHFMGAEDYAGGES